MAKQGGIGGLTVAVLLTGLLLGTRAPACCPAPPRGQPVVNADQTVILLWDAATKTQHFIRKASFKSAADDFGFIVPTPSQPELAESGGDAFPFVEKLTAPEVRQERRPGIGIGCAAKLDSSLALPARVDTVTVLQEKEVAGFNAVVLEATSASALVGWLKEHGYAYSPEVAAWAKPYVEQGWKFTALKVAKSQPGAERSVAAASLRISFRTERPLFPYREPDPKAAAAALGMTKRLLRIYFVAEARYRGELTKEAPWTGTVAWAGKLKPEARKELLTLLQLPLNALPETVWLTEFEDVWPYQSAPADVYFARDPRQDTVRRKPIVEYVSNNYPQDATLFALAACFVVPTLLRRFRRKTEC